MRSLGLFTILSLLTACGAQTKSAADVAGIFATGGGSLQSRETSLCNALAARTSPPTTNGLSLNLGGCTNAGLQATNFQGSQGFYFSGLDGLSSAPAEKSGQSVVINTSARGQIWLNKSILDLAGSVSSLMNAQGANGAGIISLPEASGGGLGSLATPTLTTLQAPALDPANFSFSSKINIKVSGIVTVDNDLQIDGRLINDMFAVVV